MFIALNIDRNNISNAVSDNMLKDLNITRGDYVGHSLHNCVTRIVDSVLTQHRTLVKPLLESDSSWLNCHRS